MCLILASTRSSTQQANSNELKFINQNKLKNNFSENKKYFPIFFRQNLQQTFAVPFPLGGFT